jgi:hypothetical protein
MAKDPTRSRWYRWPLRLVLLLGLLLLGPIAVLAFGNLDLETHWRDADFRSVGLAPRPRDVDEPLVQVYGARAYNWRGAFGIHTWIATKRQGSDHYKVYQVIGWNLHRGRSAVSVSRTETPDHTWYNAPPELLVERRGSGAEALIDRIEASVADYPYADEYRVWPGPNSNTFTAFVARQVPELGLDLPPTAIGKDYLAEGRLFDTMPSGSGWQFSLLGLLGIGVGWEEGLEVNLLGLSAGLDINDLALRLPGFGRVEGGRDLPQG